MKKFLLYYQTLKYLQLKQIGYRSYYGCRGIIRQLIRFSYRPQAEIPTFNPILLAKSLPAAEHVFFDNNTFKFLNLDYHFKEGIDWNYSHYKKLWTYNLNYFEFLHLEDLSKEEGLLLINDFINQNTTIKDGFEPYPLSLRIIHWVKFLTYNQIDNPQINSSLYNQLAYLIDQREYHILGNHLLENGFGLLFGAYYFQDKKIYTYAKKILIPELKEQILTDGAHFELSPMYHQLMLYRVLDCYNLIVNNPTVFEQELLSFFQEKAELMLGWLQQITFSNGKIPLVNDAAEKINPTTIQLSAYASQLGLKEKRVNLKDSGYRKIERGNYEVLIDIGAIGPDYIPGHAHSDTFNIIQYVNEYPFIIDTGTSTYNLSNRRLEERSTASHNTVKIENYEQAEVWSSFRVGRRNCPEIIKDERYEIAGQLKYATANVEHGRIFRFFEEKVIVEDRITPTKIGKAYFHFHPDVEVSLTGNQLKTNLGNLVFEGASSIKIEKYNYAPEFNILVESKMAVAFFNEKLITSILC